jgi:hypothetical protein
MKNPACRYDLSSLSLPLSSGANDATAVSLELWRGLESRSRIATMLRPVALQPGGPPSYVTFALPSSFSVAAAATSFNFSLRVTGAGAGAMRWHFVTGVDTTAAPVGTYGAASALLVSNVSSVWPTVPLGAFPGVLLDAVQASCLPSRTQTSSVTRRQVRMRVLCCTRNRGSRRGGMRVGEGCKVLEAGWCSILLRHLVLSHSSSLSRFLQLFTVAICQR